MATPFDQLVPPLAPSVEETEPWPVPSVHPVTPRGPRLRRPIIGRPAPAPRLPAAPALFPWIARHLAPGEATVWAGPPAAIEPLLEYLYAGNALARGRLSLLEGANRFHPYQVGEAGRALGVDATETLRHLRLARAFTAYQLVALADGWSTELRRHPPTLLVAHELPALFDVDEVAEDERRALLDHIARSLARLLREVPVPLVLTLHGGLGRFPGLGPNGPRMFDYVTVARGVGALRLHALRDDAHLALVARPSGQRGLDEFVPEAEDEEVIAWDAQPRRTARRSRSG